MFGRLNSQLKNLKKAAVVSRIEDDSYKLWKTAQSLRRLKNF